MSLSIKNLYVIIARDITTDASDQMTTISKIIERFGFGFNPEQMKEQGVTLGGVPVLFPGTYSVATSWRFSELLKKDTFLTFAINIKSPKGEIFEGPSQEHLVPSGIDRLNMNFNMDGMPVTKAGNCTMIVKVMSKEGKELAAGEYPFVVDLIKEESVNR